MWWSWVVTSSSARHTSSLDPIWAYFSDAYRFWNAWLPTRYARPVTSRPTNGRPEPKTTNAWQGWWRRWIIWPGWAAVIPSASALSSRVWQDAAWSSTRPWRLFG